MIFKYRITNVLNQTTKFTRIVSVGEESLDFPLLLQWGQISKNIFQSPANPCVSDPILVIGSAGLPFQFLSAFSLLDVTPGDRFAQQFYERLDPGC